MQRAGEAANATAILNDAIPVAQFAPEIMNNFDFDGYLEVMRDARAAPAKMFRSTEEKEAIAAQQQQQQQMQQMVDAAPQVAGSIKDIAQAEALGGQ
jgi:hypothetical protein